MFRPEVETVNKWHQYRGATSTEGFFTTAVRGNVFTRVCMSVTLLAGRLKTLLVYRWIWEIGSLWTREELVTFRVRSRRGEMYIGHGRLRVLVSVCLPLAAFPHYSRTRM